jgi:glycosyltransferase EpsE
MPKVSVIMGIFNCASTLVEALDSIYSQSFQDFEVILCDDGSTDNTYEVAKEYSLSHHNIILLKNDKNIKLAATLNHCLEYAKGEYVARMDGDDISLPDRFEKEVAFLDKNPEYSIVSCPMIYFDQLGEFARGRAITEPKAKDFGKGTPFCHAPCMMRLSDLREVGYYSTKRRVERMEDFYLWYKFYKAGYKGYNLSEHLYMMRDDRDAIGRRRTKNRINGMFADIEVFKGLDLPLRYSVFSVFKNFVQILIPVDLYQLLHKKRINGSTTWL